MVISPLSNFVWVSIKGLSRAAVLAALYNKAKVQGMGVLQFVPEDMSEEQAQEILTQQQGRFDFDYLKGRVIKVFIRPGEEEFNPSLYDRDNGEGAAKRAIESLRKQNQPS